VTDCLIIGFNDTDFAGWVEMIRSMGERNGAFRDLNLAYVEHGGRPRRSMDLLNEFHFPEATPTEELFSNTDFLWPTITYLGTYLDRRGFSFDYVNQFHLEKDSLREKLLAGDVRTVAITTTLYVSPHPILEIIRFVRSWDERVKILVGGPFVSNQVRMASPEEVQKLFQYMGADIYVISQEGEFALTQLLSALKAGDSLSKVDNIAYLEEGHYVLTPTSLERNPLEENMIDYSLFRKEDVGEFVSLRTAKSCPFACAFCGFPQRAGKYQYTGVELVEAELDRLAALGTVTTLTFLDDTFNVPKKRFQEILRMMIRKGYGFKWNSFYRSDHGDPETIELMAQAGCEGVFLGIESGSDRMLGVMNKTSRRKNYLEAIPLLQAVGISAHANFIIGFPTETRDSVAESFSLIEEARPDFFRAQLWYADPVTPIWDRREEFGVRGSGFSWSHDTMDCDEASDLVDRAFLSIRNSVWLPQHGFEQWSTFYLQRKGMSLARIKTFLRAFNSGVREKLLFPHRRELSPEIVTALADGARFDREQPVDLGPIERWESPRYQKAEQFWGEGFRRHHPEGGLERVLDLSTEVPETWREVPVEVDATVVGTLGGPGAERSEAALAAALAALLGRITAEGDQAIVVASFEAGRRLLLPLRLSAEPGHSFSSLRREAERALAAAREHELHAFALLADSGWMAQREAVCPRWEAAVLVAGGGGSPEEKLVEMLAFHPRIGESLRLVLAFEPGPGDAGSGAPGSSGVQARLFHRLGAGEVAADAARELAAELGTLLREAVATPESTIAELGAGARPEVPDAVLSHDASEAFNF